VLDITNGVLDTINGVLDTINCVLDIINCVLDTINGVLDKINVVLDWTNSYYLVAINTSEWITLSLLFSFTLLADPLCRYDIYQRRILLSIDTVYLSLRGHAVTNWVVALRHKKKLKVLSSIPLSVIGNFLFHNSSGNLASCPGLYKNLFTFNLTKNKYVLGSEDTGTMSKRETFTACRFKA
jgi:hypothetical protein